MVKISKILHETVSAIQETLMSFALQYVEDRKKKCEYKYFDAGSHKDGTGGQCSFNQCPLTCKLVKWMIEKKGD